jgi:hypothetical protein
VSRILVTGSRYWTDIDKVRRTLELFAGHPYGEIDLPELVHGDARGLDRMASMVWQDWMGPTLAYPALWEQHGNAAGPIRNQAMVDAGGYSVCLAFPIGESRGTRDCMARARTAGILVVEVS